MSNEQELAWVVKLQNRGMRITAPRRRIIQIILDSQTALSAQEIFNRAQSDCPDIGLITVYRTIEELEELNMVQRVHLSEGCNKYVKAVEGHQHLVVCEQCGRIISVGGDDFVPLASQITIKTGYLITAHWLQFGGVCPECLKHGVS